MAAIRKRGDKWQARIRIKGQAAIEKSFSSKTDAEAWAKITEAEMIRGVFIKRTDAERTTLCEALDRYEREVTPGKRGAETERQRIKALEPGFDPRQIPALALDQRWDLAADLGATGHEVGDQDRRRVFLARHMKDHLRRGGLRLARGEEAGPVWSAAAQQHPEVGFLGGGLEQQRALRDHVHRRFGHHGAREPR